ncbi:MAG: hypothetical protein ACXWZR_12480, partial [Mycobacterium sp.]
MTATQPELRGRQPPIVPEQALSVKIRLECAVSSGTRDGIQNRTLAADLYNFGPQCHARGMNEAASTLLEIEA